MNCSKNTNFVVPGKTLSELLRLLKDDGDETVTLHIATRHIVFTLDNYTLVSRLLEGEFLDYHSALPKQKTTEITVKVRDFVESVERVSLLITDRLKTMKFDCFAPLQSVGQMTDSRRTFRDNPWKWVSTIAIY